MVDEQTPDSYLGTAIQVMEETGFAGLVREEVRQLWRANCERHEPEQLFDDSATLGFLASRNVSNAVRERTREEGVAESHLDEFGVRVYNLAGFAVRLFKTTGSVGRNPRLQADFAWDHRESRLAAARRNDRFRRPIEVPGHEAMFDVPVSPESDVSLLNDVFLVWGGDIESRLTGGWLGFPSTRHGSWVTVKRIWWDTELPQSSIKSKAPSGDVNAGISGLSIPTPVVTLRKNAGRINAE